MSSDREREFRHTDTRKTRSTMSQRRIFTFDPPCLPRSLVPKLRLGNARLGSSASSATKQSSANWGSQAGAWEPDKGWIYPHPQAASFLSPPCLASALVPKLRLGNARLGSSASLPQRSHPISNNLNHPRLPRVVARARPSPMQRVVYISTSHRVVLHVLELLLHHLVVSNLLWFAALLPDLILAFGLVW